MKRAKRADAFPEWKRIQRTRAGRAAWVATKRAQGLCFVCGKEPALKGGRGDACRVRHLELGRQAYRRARNGRRRQRDLTDKELRAVYILSRGSTWTPSRFASVMWPMGAKASGAAGRFLSLLTKPGWVMREQIGYRHRVYRLSAEGHRLLAENRAFLESQKGQAA